MKKHLVICCLALGCFFSSVVLLCSFKSNYQCEASDEQIENATDVATKDHCWCSLDANCICTCGHKDHRLYKNTYE
jgi:hypothetical protein